MGRNIQNRKAKPTNKGLKLQQQPTNLITQSLPRRQQFLLHLAKTKKEKSDHKKRKTARSARKSIIKFTGLFCWQDSLTYHVKKIAGKFRDVGGWRGRRGGKKINNKKNWKRNEVDSLIRRRTKKEKKGRRVQSIFREFDKEKGIRSCRQNILKWTWRDRKSCKGRVHSQA